MLGRHEKFADAVVGFVRENVRKVTSADVAFIPGGATSDGAIAWAELGVANAERTADEAESKKAAKKRKNEDMLFAAMQEAPAILAKISNITDLMKLSVAQLITLHRSVLRTFPKYGAKKMELIEAVTPEISKEIERRNQLAEPQTELRGVPVLALADAIDAEMPEICNTEPLPDTQTSPEPLLPGGIDEM